jgi:arginine decarboxylase
VRELGGAREIEDQIRAPLLQALAAYQENGVTRLHMPGHKGGRNLDPQVRELLGDKAFSLDITGVEGMDDLHQPQGIIRESQELLAGAFGADHSYFLVNGTSCGVQALLLSLCSPGDKVLVPRNMHKSMIAGVILSGAQPVFIGPEILRSRGIALGVTPEKVKLALEKIPDIKGALLINPTYYGTVTDLPQIRAALTRRGVPLLLDEAHGPHFYFHEEFPLSGLRAGADAVAQGMHKLLGGLTQGSILHLQGGAVDRGRLENSLRLLQSTSASYLLLASLDGARRQMVLRGQELLTDTLHLARWARREINAIPGLSCLGRGEGGPGFTDFDETKLTVTVKEIGLTGQQVEQILRYEYNIQVELSDLYNILLMITIGSTREDIEKLLYALGKIVSRRREFPDNRDLLARADDLMGEMTIPQLAVLPREAFFAPSHRVKLNEAVGEISTEIITAYPPGIPVICPGERITREITEYLALIKDANLRISGPLDTDLEYIQVISGGRQ